MYNLIVVDDEKKLLSGLCDYYPWNDLGYQIVARLTDGQKALQYIRNYPVDVVLTDISMPNLNGIGLAEIIKREYPQIRVILLSGYADFKYAQQAIRFNIKGYLLKPVKLDELKQVFTTVKEELDKTVKSEDGEEPDSYYQSIIGRVQKYVRANLSDANLKTAAEQVNLSPSYLSVLFSQNMGISFTDYLLQMRMESAKQLLDSPDYKIYDIASIVGYKSPKNFSRAFSLYYGYSPREYRKNS
ncbi:MAG: response regulator [Clostridiaceae bacterium]|nr:response regulator [Clostridiaceae bacterium]